MIEIFECFDYSVYTVSHVDDTLAKSVASMLHYTTERERKHNCLAIHIITNYYTAVNTLSHSSHTEMYP